jgi:hypothetical protein
MARVKGKAARQPEAARGAEGSQTMVCRVAMQASFLACPVPE